jgi:DivIVA domain-containing protein
MDLTAQAIRSVEFREKLRGYHPDDVDAFVEEVATEVDALHRRVQELELTVQAPAATVAAGDSVSDETLRRTLLMAQRTADLVVKEAQEVAAATVSEAHARADAIVAEALVTADASAVEVRARLQAEIAHLEETRDHLSADGAALQEYLDGQRARLHELLTEQLRMLDDPSALRLEPPPAAVVDLTDEPDGEAAATSSATPSSPWAAGPPTVSPEPSLPAEVHTEAEGGTEPLADRPNAAAQQPSDPFLSELRRAVQGEADDTTQTDVTAPAAAATTGADAPEPSAALGEPSVFGGQDEPPPVPVVSTLSPGPPPEEELRGMPEGGRLAGRLFRRR